MGLYSGRFGGVTFIGKFGNDAISDSNSCVSSSLGMREKIVRVDWSAVWHFRTTLMLDCLTTKVVQAYYSLSSAVTVLSLE